ncbi:acyl-CoA dehydrogenase family protein [Rhodococcus globerulus]|uniref:Acyl-CoA dehydrogenase family protein n=1 Tax=Rhodococcus globerulus TaxID=33008 RepID=A0ABU4C5K5_RHOGO|nr:acyl-CoA dehydrogenase family protein [Rhodococcus globerulus]MDV6271792.1 acyl-CoA dehydrogenase family protein [Rhodococcus globerulus]
MTTIDATSTSVDGNSVTDIETGGENFTPESTLDRWIAESSGFQVAPAQESAFAAELREAGLVTTLGLLAPVDFGAAVQFVRRIAVVSLGVAADAADLVEAVAYVDKFGTSDQIAQVEQATAAGRPVGVAIRTADPAGLGQDDVVAASRVRSKWKSHLIVVPVDAPGGARSTALVSIVDGAVPVAGTVVEKESLLVGSRVRSGVELVLWSAALLGGVEQVVNAAAVVAREHGKPWSGRTYERVIDDPYVIVRFGRLRAEFHAVDRLLRDTVAGSDADHVAAAELLYSAASQLVTLVYTELPELVGAGAENSDELWAAATTLRRAALRKSVAWVESIAGQSLLKADADTGSVQPTPVVAESGIPVLRSHEEAVAVARALADRLAVDAVARDHDRRHGFAELQDLARTGLLGLTVPTEFGGSGASIATVIEVVRIIATADGSIAQILQPHFGALDVIDLTGTPDQKRYFFAEALGGARFGNATGELGTKAAGDIRTRLIHSPDGGFKVDGNKAYATGSYSADWVPVSVRDPAGNRASAVVSRTAEGVEIVDDWSGFGQRTTASGSARFTGVRIFEHHVIATWRAGEGSHLMGATANLVHGAVNVGIAAGALAATKNYVLTKARPSKDLPIESVVEDPHVVRRYGLLAARLAVAESGLARAADLVDAAGVDQTPASISAATIAAAETEALGSEIGLEIASELFALSGASSSRSELGLDRFWRDIRTHSLHDHMIWKYHQSGDALLSGAYYFGNRRTLY